MLQACLGVHIDGWFRPLHRLIFPALPGGIDRLTVRPFAGWLRGHQI
jgi:hypothetical protein